MTKVHPRESMMVRSSLRAPLVLVTVIVITVVLSILATSSGDAGVLEVGTSTLQQGDDFTLLTNSRNVNLTRQGELEVTSTDSTSDARARNIVVQSVGVGSSAEPITARSHAHVAVVTASPDSFDVSLESSRNCSSGPVASTLFSCVELYGATCAAANGCKGNRTSQSYTSTLIGKRIASENNGDHRRAVEYNCTLRDAIRHWNTTIAAMLWTCHVLSVAHTLSRKELLDHGVPLSLVVGEDYSAKLQERHEAHREACRTLVELVEEGKYFDHNRLLHYKKGKHDDDGFPSDTADWMARMRASSHSGRHVDMLLRHYLPRMDAVFEEFFLTPLQAEANALRKANTLGAEHRPSHLARTEWYANISLTTSASIVSQEHDGCTSRSFRVVRIAVVGDWLSMNYPRRLRNWIRGLCVCPNEQHMSVTFDLQTFVPVSREFAHVMEVDGARNETFASQQAFVGSLKFDADIIVLMIGSSDAIRFAAVEGNSSSARLESLSKRFDVGRFLEAYRNIALQYLAQPAQPDVILVAPPPLFTAVKRNVSRKGKFVLRVQKLVADVATEVMATVVVPAIRNITASFTRRGPEEGRVHFLDLHEHVMQWLAREALHLAQSRNQVNEMLRDFDDSAFTQKEVLALLASSSLSHHAEERPARELALGPNYLGNFRLYSRAGQHVVMRELLDGLGMQKTLQKVIGALVMEAVTFTRSTNNE